MKKIFTKIVIVAAMALPAQLAFSQNSSHDGLYMGVEGSYSKIKNNNMTVVEPDYSGFVYEDDIQSNTTINPLYSAEGAGAGFFVGYRLSEGQFTLATEATYGYSFITNEVSATSSFEQTNEFGITVMPGMWVNDNIVVYGHLGASQLQNNTRFGSENFKNSDTGFVFGAGIQLFANEQVSVRVSYTRSTHNHTSGEWINVYELNNGEAVLSDTAYFEYDSTLRRDKFAASLVYQF